MREHRRGDTITKRYPQKLGFQVTGPKGREREVGGSDKELVGLCD